MFNPEDTIQLSFDFGQTTEKAGEVTRAIKEIDAATEAAMRKALEFSQAGVKLESLAGGFDGVAKQAKAADAAHADFGRGLLQVSFAVQDFTSQLSGGRGLAGALAAVQNNIPVILTGLGLGSGLAGVLSIASVGVGVLTSSLGGMSAEAKQAAKDLEDVTRAADRLRTAQGPGEKKGADDITGWMAGQGQAIGQGIQAALTTRARAQGLAAEREQLQQFGVVTESAERFVARNMPQIKADADRLLARMPTERGARQFVHELAQQAPGNFPRGFAADLEGFETDTGDADLAEAEAFGERAHRGTASRRRAAATAHGRIVNMRRLAEEEAQAEAEMGGGWRAGRAAGWQANPPPFYDRRLPVGRIDAGPGPAVMTPAQQRAFAQQQARGQGTQLQNMTMDEAVKALNQTVRTNDSMLTVMGRAQASLIEARQKLKRQEQQANTMLNRGRE